jgi:hypothetical protein
MAAHPIPDNPAKLPDGIFDSKVKTAALGAADSIFFEFFAGH